MHKLYCTCTIKGCSWYIFTAVCMHSCRECDNKANPAIIIPVTGVIGVVPKSTLMSVQSVTS